VVSDAVPELEKVGQRGTVRCGLRAQKLSVWDVPDRPLASHADRPRGA
jgi:hypothetical protein